MRNHNQSQQGQALLLVVMLMATVITVVMTVAFKTSTDTQITKLEQESQKGLAAAESGIEQALSSKAVSGTGTIAVGDFSGQYSISQQTQIRQFDSPLLQKDQQYTFYLTDYDPNRSPDPFGPASYGGTINLYFSSEGQDCDSISLELTLISGPLGNVTTQRYVADHKSNFGSGRPEGNLTVGGGRTFDDGTKFNCGVQLAAPAQGKVMIVRPFYANTRIGVESSGGTFLPSQGKVITSDVQSNTGSVRKTVQLFQSFPQIPTDFFVTQFSPPALPN